MLVTINIYYSFIPTMKKCCVCSTSLGSLKGIMCLGGKHYTCVECLVNAMYECTNNGCKLTCPGSTPCNPGCTRVQKMGSNVDTGTANFCESDLERLGGDTYPMYALVQVALFEKKLRGEPLLPEDITDDKLRDLAIECAASRAAAIHGVSRDDTHTVIVTAIAARVDEGSE